MFPTVFPLLGGEWWQREQVMRQGCFKGGRDKWGEKGGGALSQLWLERWRTAPMLPLSGQAPDHTHLPHPAQRNWHPLGTKALPAVTPPHHLIPPD